jgi:hypothetical protein
MLNTETIQITPELLALLSEIDASGNMIGVVFETATPFDTPQR